MYPPIAPPTVSVTCQYPGASAQVVAETVAAPIEQQVNGVENMMYMSSTSANDGNYSLTVTFKHGINMNLAQVLVQNRVALANPLLPDVIKATGVTVKKQSPDILLAIGIWSPDGRFDQLYLSNYAQIYLQPELARLPGISEVRMFGQRDYSMRVWLDPDKLAIRNMTAGDVVAALREQNLPVASGQLGQSPTVAGQNTQITLTTLGRLVEPKQFADIIVKKTPDDRVVRLRDVVAVRWDKDGRIMRDVNGREIVGVEIGAKNQDTNAKVDGMPVANLAVFQLPDANALDTADIVKAKIAELKKDFPEGIDYLIRYDTTPFIRESIQEVFKTLLDSVVLVALVVLIFLQNWRSSIIPLVAVPVGIVGTFAVMLVMGFSLNNLTLFGLVLAIGIVVDDAIVVVEAVEHHIEHGLKPRAATLKAMSEVSAPVIAVGLVLSAVFIPCAFITGITGQFFRQFALTIASLTVISTINSLTLSPALSAMLLKPKRKGVYDALPWPAFALIGAWAGWAWGTPYLLEHYKQIEPHLQQVAEGSHHLDAWATTLARGFEMGRSAGIPPETAALLGGILAGVVGCLVIIRPANRVLRVIFHGFNRGFTATANGYAWFVGEMLRRWGRVLLVYGGLLGVTWLVYNGLPHGARDRLYRPGPPGKTAGGLIGDAEVALLGEDAPKSPVPGAPPAKPAAPGTLGLKKEVARKILDAAKGLATFTGTPRGFIPSQDMGYLLINIQLPDSASLERTQAVIDRINDIGHETPGVNATVGIAGQSLLLNAFGSNFGTMFMTLDSFDKRQTDDLYYETIMNKLRKRLGEEIAEATIMIFGPPPVRGVGRAGGFMIMVEDRGDLGPPDLQAQVENLVDQANKAPELVPGGNTSVFRANVPQVYLDVNRTALMLKGVRIQDVFQALQIYLGSLYVNDFNLFGRTWQVIVQAEAKYRDQLDDIRRLRVRNSSGTMVPVGAVADVKMVNGPLVLTRYNMYPAASINGNARPGVSSGRRHRRHVGPGAAGAAQVDVLRVDRAGLPRAPGRQHGDDRLRFLDRDGLPGAGGAVRELVDAAGGDPVGAALRPGRPDRRQQGRPGHQHLHPDRPGRAGGPGEQERDPDRRVRQGDPPVGPADPPGDARGVPAAAAADHHDVDGVHPRRAAALVRPRRRRRDAAVAGHGRLQRHAGRDLLRHPADPGVLLPDRYGERDPRLRLAAGAAVRVDRAGHPHPQLPVAAVPLGRARPVARAGAPAGVAGRQAGPLVGAAARGGDRIRTVRARGTGVTTSCLVSSSTARSSPRCCPS